MSKAPSPVQELLLESARTGTPRNWLRLDHVHPHIAYWRKRTSLEALERAGEVEVRWYDKASDAPGPRARFRLSRG